jgi:cytochrome c biogenesis protein CcmG/thiol:disulfide interchange protein DsbE
MTRRLAALLFAAALGLPACARGMPPSVQHPLAGAQAPRMAELSASSEQTQVGLPQGAAVKVVVVDFWASWCPTCQQSLPALDALYRDKREDGVRVVGVSIDEHAESAYAFAASLHATFPVVVDDGRLAHSFGVGQVPLTFVVDGGGTVRWVGNDAGAARRAVEAVLAE